LQKFKNPDNDPRGIWTSGDLTSKTKAANHSYPITSPSGKIHYPPNGRQWAASLCTFETMLNENRIWFGENGENVPRIKQFLNEIQDGVVPMSIWKHDDVGHNQSATQELKKIFDGLSLFDSPKPTTLLKRILYLASKSADIILDFFSGSATTAHAIMQLNAEDNGNRKFIMVQLPEPCDEKTEAHKAGYKTIADIGKERIRRAGEKILQDNADKEGIDNLDIGFKVFKLDSSNIKPWDADFDNLEDTLLNIVDNIKEDRSEDDVLTEILLKYGLDLTVPIEERQVSGKTVYIIGFGALVVCLADAITLEVVEGIGHLKAEWAPEVMRVVFKDSGFKDDVVKTNAIQILKQYGIDDVKSL
jgi:adenine-specific DNA-methyltransferase